MVDMLAVCKEDPTRESGVGQGGRDSSHTGKGPQGGKSILFLQSGQQPFIGELHGQTPPTILLWAAGTSQQGQPQTDPWSRVIFVGCRAKREAEGLPPGTGMYVSVPTERFVTEPSGSRKELRTRNFIKIFFLTIFKN